MENNHPLKLKKTSEFVAIKSNGKRQWASRWLLLGYRPNDVGRIRYGVTASRKTGPSVVRNKLKRWCREFIRQEFRAGFNIEVDVNFVFQATSGDFFKNLSFAEFQATAKSGLSSIRKRSSRGI